MTKLFRWFRAANTSSCVRLKRILPFYSWWCISRNSLIEILKSVLLLFTLQINLTSRVSRFNSFPLCSKLESNISLKKALAINFGPHNLSRGAYFIIRSINWRASSGARGISKDKPFPFLALNASIWKHQSVKKSLKKLTAFIAPAFSSSFGRLACIDWSWFAVGGPKQSRIF